MSGFTKKFDSNSQEWSTPNDLFERLNDEFHFELDLAACSGNAKCAKYYNKEQNGLLQPWNGVCWLNPPYGDAGVKLSDWVAKGYYETLENESLVVVMLIPARTNTKWFHKFCMKAAEIRFLCGRPRFGDAKHGLPQPLALVVFKHKPGPTKFSSYYV